MMIRVLIKVFVMGCLLGGPHPWLTSSEAAPRPKPRYSKRELNYANPPTARFRDKRLKEVHKVLLRQYKHIYSHAASDGYILPNEERELSFNINILNRLILVDQRNHKVLGIYHKLTRKQKLLDKYNRRSRRYRKRRKAPAPLTSDEQHLLKRAIYHRERYEKMIRRFACRYIAKYPKRNKHHCHAG